jgi:non-ribosomal peptide synthetase component E (peptide arylation enzyme)
MRADTAVVSMDDALRDRYYQAGYWTAESLWDSLQARAVRDPDAVAFVDEHRTLRYAELIEEAAAFGCALGARGIGAGEPVLIVGRNVHSSAVALLGCWRQGLVAVPVPPMYSSSQLASIASNCRARVLVCTADGDAQVQATAAVRSAGVGLFITGQRAEGALAWADLLAEGAAGCLPTPGTADVLAMLIYSSGTTGVPKGVMHSANTIRYTARQMAALHALNARDIVLVVCQFGFIGSIVFGFLVTMLTGACAVLLTRWKPERALELIVRHRATYTLMMPTHIVDVLASPMLSSTDCSSLRRGVLAGINREQREHAAQTLCALPFPMFGMSECAGLTTCSMDDSSEKWANTDGHPLPGAEMKILDDDGRVLPPGVAGHVLVRGPSRCLGYFNAPELTHDALTADGFFRTGDLGSLDEDGYFTFGTRARDVIRRGGVTIIPAELEDQLSRHPMVQHAAIVALPDARLGERACACIVLRGTQAPDLDALNAYLAAQGVPAYLLPEYVLVFEEFPRTASLKVKKAELVQLAQRCLDAERAKVAVPPGVQRT